MKYLRLIGAAILTLTILNEIHAQRLTITPERPQVGDTVTIHYKAPSDTIQQIRLVFTYSNFYNLPISSAMEQQKDNNWVKKFVIPPYGIYACFYLQVGDKKIQPSANEQYAIMVYGTDAQPVEKAMLYKAYSMGAQLSDRTKVKAAQQRLLTEELAHYPDNYEAQLRQVALHMASANAEQKTALVNKGNEIIAKKYNQTMPGMDALNQITMGYLILGEKSRLDSIREITMQRFPEADVSKELLYGKITNLTDTPDIVRQIHQQLQQQTAENTDAMRDYHGWLFNYYVAKGQSAKALQEARLSVTGLKGPYLPVQLKQIAALLAEHHIAPDTAMKYAQRSMALLDSFPVGVIRYFKETGYIRPFVEDSVRQKELSKQKAILLATMAQIQLNKNNKKAAVELAAKATLQDPNEEVLRRTALVYDGTGHSDLAFRNYRNILLANPLDTAIIPSLKTAYINWKNSRSGLADTLRHIYEQRRLSRMALLEKEALHQKAPSLAGIVDLKGKPVSPNDLKGKILVIDFWATWCIPCMHEMPYLQKVYDKFKNDKRVAFMITNSGANNTLADAQKWKAKVAYSFPVYMHTNPNVGEVFEFNVIPALYVIDNKGLLQYKTIGFEGPSVQETLTLEIELLLSKMK